MAVTCADLHTFDIKKTEEDCYTVDAKPADLIYLAGCLLQAFPLQWSISPGVFRRKSWSQRRHGRLSLRNGWDGNGCGSVPVYRRRSIFEAHELASSIR